MVSLTSSNPAALESAGHFDNSDWRTECDPSSASTSVVSANTPVTITASYNNSSKAATVTVLPPPPPGDAVEHRFVPECSNRRQFHARHPGGDESCAAGWIYRDRSPATIRSQPCRRPSPSLRGKPTYPSLFQQPPSATSTGLTIFATAGGLTKLAPLTVNPAAPPVTTAVLTVTATGRNGERVTSSPAGINVAVGSSMQASFTSGTSIVFAVSNGRDAIWSGACSSGGKQTKDLHLYVERNCRGDRQRAVKAVHIGDDISRPLPVADLRLAPVIISLPCRRVSL